MTRESVHSAYRSNIPAIRKELVVLINGQRVGRIGINRIGAIFFLYDEGYEGVPLSVSMPDVPDLWDAAPQILKPGKPSSSPFLTHDLYKGERIPLGEAERPPRAFRERIVRPYLFGLLPDASEQRESLGREFGVKPDDALGLLSHVGLDLPGAVQLCPPNEVERVVSEDWDYEPISDAEIAADLRRITGDHNPSWQMPREHWSLGGNQPKLAYAYLHGSWYRCNGAAATTHIVKPGILSLKHEALNETACLRLANACGIPAVEASYRCFEDVPAIVVSRYDREIDGDRVTRLHQEDLCQALSVMPEKKYASEGGPSAPDVMRLLSQLPFAQDNKIIFTMELFFNLLVMAPDAHAKNYSLVLREDGVHMAPLYDCASGAAYEPNDGKPWRLAMGIGGTTLMDRVDAHKIERYARTVGLDEELCLNLLGNIAIRVLENFDAVFAAIRAEVPSQAQAIDELQQKLEGPISHQAERLIGEVLAALGG